MKRYMLIKLNVTVARAIYTDFTCFFKVKHSKMCTFLFPVLYIPVMCSFKQATEENVTERHNGFDVCKGMIRVANVLRSVFLSFPNYLTVILTVF